LMHLILAIIICGYEASYAQQNIIRSRDIAS
jgi:hypothetical protein